jgi:hypothetical protein
MKKSILIIICSLLFLPLCNLHVYAQKKEINEAIDKIKANKDLDKVEASMTKLLKDSANRHNEKIWNLLFESLEKQYQSGNEKLYLKQKYDTASLFNIASRMYTAMTDYDSIDALPDKKGRVKLKMRKQNASTLNTIRPNLFNGGIYFIGKQNYKQAYALFDQYISAAEMPMFKSYNYSSKDKYLPTAAYWAAYCGYKMNDAKKVLHNTYLALKDKQHHESMMQYLSATYMLEKDTARSVETLKEGFHSYPTSSYFFAHLIDYYSGKADWKKANELTDKAIQANRTNATAWLTKSTLLINTGDYEHSFLIADSLLKRDSTMTDAWLNAGLAKFNMGVNLDKNPQNVRQKRQLILKYYKEALPYLEQYRKLAPKETSKWALPLYTIYLNLNMGKQFDEIDKILRNKS